MCSLVSQSNRGFTKPSQLRPWLSRLGPAWGGGGGYSLGRSPTLQSTPTQSPW